MKRQMRPVKIRRTGENAENEINAAIEELQGRGFKLIYGPVAEYKEGKSFTRDRYNRKLFIQNIESDIWVAQLQKIDEEEGEASG